METKAKRGAKNAIVAVARKLLVIIYNLLKNNDTFNEEKFELTKNKQEALRIKKLNSDAKRLGFELVPVNPAS